MGNFQAELEALINRYSRENESNTPDFILARFMEECLKAFEFACRERERWYGKKMVPGVCEDSGLTATVSSGTAFVGPTRAEKALKEIVGLVDEHVALSPELRTAPGWVVSKIYKIAREASE